MAESTLTGDTHLPVQSSKALSNGHHHSDMPEPIAMTTTNGFQNEPFTNGNRTNDPFSSSHAQPTSPVSSDPSRPRLSFSDDFVESVSHSNGSAIYDDDEEDDDFIDQFELARIRHLSTIVEGPAENSNSSSDCEDPDYIRLDKVSLMPAISDTTPETKQEESTETTAENGSEDIPPVVACLDKDSSNDRTPQNDSPSLTVSSPQHLSNEGDVNQDQIENENTDPTPDVRTAPSPNGFLAFLSDALAAPPVLDGVQGQQDDQMMKGTLSPPLTDPWLLPSHQASNIPMCLESELSMCSMDDILSLPLDSDQPLFNMLPSVTPIDQFESNLQPDTDHSNTESQPIAPNLYVTQPLNISSSPDDDYARLADMMLLSSGETPVIIDQSNQNEPSVDAHDIPNTDDSAHSIRNNTVDESPVLVLNSTTESLDVFHNVEVSDDSSAQSPTSTTAQPVESTNTAVDQGQASSNIAVNSSPVHIVTENVNAENTVASNTQLVGEANLDSNLKDTLLNTSNLDRGTRTVEGRQRHFTPLGPTLSSPGSSNEGSPVVMRRRVGDSPLTRRKNITSSPVTPRKDGELGVLQPLSPEHGVQMNEQYDFLRRTLSHSHRRYSTRRRPNKGKGAAKRNQEEQGDDPGLENSLAPTERSVNMGSPGRDRRWRDILISTEVSPGRRNTGLETHVDQHGRTYYMDHTTRTIAFNDQRRRTQVGASTELDTRREMLERRYRSLQRSFRRSSDDRPTVSRRNQRAGLSPSGSNTLQDNMSLTLTREEADAMLRRQSATQNTPRSKSKKKRNSSGSSRRWPFSRKSSKTIVQTTPTSRDDDFLPVFSPSAASGDLEFTIPDPISPVVASPQRSTSGSVESESSLTRSSGLDVSAQIGGVAAVGVAIVNEREATPESSGSGPIRDREESVVTEGQQGGTELLEVESRNMSPEISDLGRQSSIVRSSWLSNADRSAAVVARRRASSRGHQRRDTDEVTNEELATARRSTVIEPSPAPSSEPEITERTTEEDEADRTRVRELSEALTNCPALNFVTRKDLYKFLNSAGLAGKEFIASRALMELVQRIRSDNFLFEKYQHSKHLVNALNKFADDEADLPEEWEKKLNQQGKVFFIDHKHKLTTFIDPRLPLPDQEFTYNTQKASQSVQASRRSVLYNDEPEVRPHHVTTVGSSTPSVEVTTPSPNESATPTNNEASQAAVQDNSVASDVTTSTSTPPSYEDQVVAFFRKPDVVDQINRRYQRGVRPQFRNIIEEVRLHGNPALQRIQMSGSIAAYELALVLSLFEEDISRIQLTPQALAAPVVAVNPPPPPVPTPSRNTVNKNTLQRKKEAFSTKLQHFKIMMVRMGFAQGSRLKFNIRRDHMLEDAYEHVMKSDIKQLQTKRLNIAFKGEEGLDYGGPSREFFFLLSREIFNPYYGLFEYSANDTYTVQINPTSAFLQNSMDWLRFAGRVLGLVIVQGFLLDAFFTRTVYKAILSRAPTLKDLEALEPAFYNSLLWIRENDPEPLDLTYTVEEEAFGTLTTHELKPGGLDLLVNEDNKEEYIHLMLKWRLDRGVAKQMEILKKGFAEVMPPHLLVDFDAHELEFITAGTVEIDVEDWRTYTEYRNGYHHAHPVIVWFWQAVESFDNEQRLRLLQFVTGTSSVPFEGFKALRGSNGPKRFTIDFYSDVNAFPRTHTCFNRIDLPPYSSYETLFEKLLFAIQEGGGFGIE